jgi:hypothetical protein
MRRRRIQRKRNARGPAEQQSQPYRATPSGEECPQPVLPASVYIVVAGATPGGKVGFEN